MTNGTDYSFQDLLTIAKGQIALEEQLAEKLEQRAAPLLEQDYDIPYFIDTDMSVMKVWCEFVFNKSHPFIEEQLAKRKVDHYFLCQPDLPWVKDQLREYPDLAKLQSLVPAAAAQGIASSSFHHAANPSSVLRHARQSTQHHQLAIDGPLRVSGGAPWITTSLTCQFPHSCPTLGDSTSYAGIVAEPAAATALSCSGAQVPSPPPTPFCRRQLLCPASVC